LGHGRLGQVSAIPATRDCMQFRRYASSPCWHRRAHSESQRGMVYSRKAVQDPAVQLAWVRR
jgi:hypothetical protein